MPKKNMQTEQKFNVKKYSFYAFPLIALILAVSILGVFGFPTGVNTANVVSGGEKVETIWCPTVIRADGTVEEYPCTHNVVYTSGLEAVEESLAHGVNHTFNTIVLCNASSGSAGCGTPVAAQSESFVPYNGCGLDAAVGTFGDNGNGNWSYWNTFTSSCDSRIVNVTKLQDQVSVNLSGNLFSSAVTLNTNDQLTVNITHFVTGG